LSFYLICSPFLSTSFDTFALLVFPPLQKPKKSAFSIFNI
jgi:hypothetical protein